MADINDRDQQGPSGYQLETPPKDEKSRGHDEFQVEDEREYDEPIQVPDPARMRKIYRKLDRRIIPAFWTLYFLCSGVRVNVGLAQTMNLRTHHDLESVLNIDGEQVATGLALFYASYVVLELPSNLVMSKLEPSVWLARIVISVGVIGTAMVGLTNAASFYVLRLLLGAVEAGMWPGLTLFLTLFYPTHEISRRIGYYFTASQVSASVCGLISAGFQKMDGDDGLVGFQWMFLLWGLVTLVTGFCLIWWLPPRPLAPGEVKQKRWFDKWLPEGKPALEGEEALLHYRDLNRAYHNTKWNLRDLGKVLIDWRVWPLVIMYFGVVGVGNGVASYGGVLIHAINPTYSGIEISLLYAPIWICDLIAILAVTPISDRFYRNRALFFSIPTALQIVGLLIAAYSGDSVSEKWGRYVGLLLVGFGLGPTVPITMTWTAEIFQARYGEVGVAAACALVSGLGNLGSVVTNYALFEGWPADATRSPVYIGSIWVMVGMLVLSIASSWGLLFALNVIRKRTGEDLIQ